jgi:hypothetical protein
MPLLPFLDLSAAHLTDGDVELLQTLRHCEPGFMGDEYGFVVSTASLISDGDWKLRRLRDAGFSEIFITIALHAAANGASLMRFDVDAEIEPGLPVGGHVEA